MIPKKMKQMRTPKKGAKTAAQISVPQDLCYAMDLAIQLALKYLAERDVLVRGFDHPQGAVFIHAWDNICELHEKWVGDEGVSPGSMLEYMSTLAELDKIK
jgi:hypothetical protein